MKACFINLFNVSFLHEYFGAAVFDALQAKPDNETDEIIKKNGFLFKPFMNGFSMLYDKYYSGYERSLEAVLGNRLTLSFSLTLADPHFYNYTTGFGADINEFIFLFTNLPGVSCPINKGSCLHRDKYVTSKDLTIRNKEETGLFGRISITINENLQHNYSIRFDQKATYLRYFLVSHFFLALEQPAIIDSSSEQKFSNAAKVTLSNGKNAVCFISENAIKFNNKATSNFNLVEDYDEGTGKYKLVRSGLPLPDVRAVSKALEDDGSVDKIFSDIFL
jgi:hypothetical protein